MTHLGLYALQHRGQESTGISSSDGDQVHSHKSMGYVADSFSEDVLKRLKGTNAIGHTRYSTAGDSSEGNAQPIVVKNIRTYGTVALVHNGNLINAVSLRDALEREGARRPGFVQQERLTGSHPEHGAPGRVRIHLRPEIMVDVSGRA